MPELGFPADTLFNLMTGTLLETSMNMLLDVSIDIVGICARYVWFSSVADVNLGKPQASFGEGDLNLLANKFVASCVDMLSV